MMDHERIREALSKGQVSVPDPTTGFHRAIYGRCTNCGLESEAYKWDKLGDGISRVIFDCPSCSTNFEAPPDQMVLR